MTTLNQVMRYAKLRAFGPKMTSQAREFITKYRNLLDGAICDADRFLEAQTNSNMVEFLKSSVQFMDGIATKQGKEHKKEMDLYLPIHIMLYMLCKKAKPRKIVETGVEKGGSTYMILKSLNTTDGGRGHLWSIDIRRYWSYGGEYVAPVGPLVTENLKKQWTFILGDAQKILESVLEKTGDLDAFMALQGHTYKVQKHESETAWPRIKRGGIFVLDRPDWNDSKYLSEFLVEYGSEIEHHETYKEGAASDPFEFTVIIKK